MKTLNTIVQNAIAYAITKHDKQIRKGTDLPYSLHPVSLAMMLLEERLKPEIVAAALLHDTIEDTETTYEELESVFGLEVTELVRACTEEDQKEKWELRKENTINKFKHQTEDAKWVILADKLHNLYSMYTQNIHEGDQMWSYFSRDVDKQKWYYQSLLSLFKKESHMKHSNMLLAFQNYYDALFEENTL